MVDSMRISSTKTRQRLLPKKATTTATVNAIKNGTDAGKSLRSAKRIPSAGYIPEKYRRSESKNYQPKGSDKCSN